MKFWIVREESKGRPIIGVHPLEKFNDHSEVVDHHHRHPCHYVVAIETGLTRAKRAWVSQNTN